MKFWIILGIVAVAIVGAIIFVKPKDSNPVTFTGDAAKVQTDDHVRNERDLPVTLIEYGDFQCPSCGAYYPMLKKLEESYSSQVTFVFRHFPLRSIHPNAQAAALAAEAAGRQGKFFGMHDKLFETQSAWGQVTTNQQSLFEGYAEELGLNMEQFRTDYVSSETAARINRDVSSGKQFDITGTPTFVLSGQKIENPADESAFRKVLDEAIKNAGGTPPAAE